MNASNHARQFSLVGHTVDHNTEGLTHEDSLVAPERGGNCLNWVLGHIVATRRTMFSMLGLPPLWEETQAEPYGRGAPNISAQSARPLPELLEAFRSTQAQLLGWLEGTGEPDLARPLPEPHELLGDTVGSALTAFAWHEAYHAGQIGILRRAAGKPGALA